jgi:hypothetical protein
MEKWTAGTGGESTASGTTERPKEMFTGKTVKIREYYKSYI